MPKYENKDVSKLKKGTFVTFLSKQKNCNRKQIIFDKLVNKENRVFIRGSMGVESDIYSSIEELNDAIDWEAMKSAWD